MSQTNEEAPFTRDELISIYMEYVTAMDLDDRSQFHFCARYDIAESTFSGYFDDFEQLEQVIWEQLMRISIRTIKSDELYKTFTTEEKILSLQYTFFENLALNHLYIAKNIEEQSSVIHKMKLLKLLKPVYSGFITNEFADSGLPFNTPKLQSINKYRNKSIQEGFWMLLIFLIDFWRKDTSDNFEKTDIAIEKSVKVAMDLVDTSRFMNVFDLGRFLWKERGAYSFKKPK